jgi:hypothetical protein
MPRFQPIPRPLGRPRTSPVHSYGRFYALYTDNFGAIHRATFQVRADKYMPKMKYHWVAITAQKMKEGYIPQHFNGQVFGSFPELHAERWVRVRKVREYEAGVHYER